MATLMEIKGLSESDAQKLSELGIDTPDSLLEHGASPKGRKTLSEQTGIDGNVLLRWINQADLSRVKGIGKEYADLLEAAGIDTVPELAQRKPENLFQKLMEINEEKKILRLMPTEELVKNWVNQAKELPRVVTY